MHEPPPEHPVSRDAGEEVPIPAREERGSEGSGAKRRATDEPAGRPKSYLTLDPPPPEGR